MMFVVWCVWVGANNLLSLALQSIHFKVEL